MIALVLGGGDCAFCDVARVRDLFPDAGWQPEPRMGDGPDAPGAYVCRRTTHELPFAWPGPVVAANDIGAHWPGGLDAWVSLHPEKFRIWTRLRSDRGHPEGYLTWTSRSTSRAKFVDRRLTGPGSSGSSGLLGVWVAREIGATGVILAGVPMERTPHFAASTVHVAGRPWSPADSHWKRWRTVAPKLSGWVRSASMVRDPRGGDLRPSRTMRLLGAPDRAWVEEHMTEEGVHGGT